MLPRPDEGTRDDLRRLPLWARRYAQTRSLGMVVGLLACAAGYLLMFGFAVLSRLAASDGNRPLAIAFMVLLFASMGLWIWLSNGGMARLLARTTHWLYRREGEVALTASQPAEEQLSQQSLAVPTVGGVALLIMVIAAPRVPPQYIQPITALWVVPVLVGVWATHRAQLGPVVLLWPVLYGLHAVLILIGAPIVLTGAFNSLNVMVPLLGYGVLTALVAHLYSRYALTRLRKLATAGADGSEQG